MNHIVINHEQRRQYLLILVGAIVFSFGLGFWFGYHTNSAEELATVLSQINRQETQDDEKLTPDWSGETRSAADTKPAAENKTSKPDSKTNLAAKPVTVPVPAKPVAKPVEKPVVQAIPVAPVVKPVTPATPVASAPVQSMPKPAVVKPVVVPPVTPAATIPSAPTPTPTPTPTTTTTTESITNSSLSAEAASTQFVVQAGVFENYDNAMKLVTELNSKGFDAYLDEFVASSGDLKFNVRFGRSSDRDQVQKRLVRFKQLYTTAAYIITLDK